MIEATDGQDGLENKKHRKVWEGLWEEAVLVLRGDSLLKEPAT